MAQIVLLHPASGYWEIFRTAFNMPLNLLSVASFVKDEYSVRIIDQRLGAGWREELRAALSDETICAGITAYTGPMINHALEMCREVRKLSNVPIVWGGIHATLMPYQTARHPLVDAVVISEGEISFKKLAGALCSKNTFSGIPGVVTEEDVNGSVPFHDFADMDSMPELPYELIDVKRYLPKFQGGGTLNFQTSRGCPSRCSFCYNAVFNKYSWRAMSAEKVMYNIEKPMKDYEIKDILFVDDNMFVNMERAREIVEGLAKLDITWQCQGIDITTLQNMTDEMLELIKRSGCHRMSLGVEAGSDRIRKLLRKPGTGEKIVREIERLKKHDFLLHCTFIAGFPSETLEEVKETTKLMLKLIDVNDKVRVPFIYKYFPCPGTEMFKMAQDLGFTPPERLEDWNEINADDFSPSRWNFPLGGGLTEEFIDKLKFATHFLDSKEEDYNVSFLYKILYKIYKPIAKLRVRRMFFHFMPEKTLLDSIIGIMVERKWGKT